MQILLYTVIIALSSSEQTATASISNSSCVLPAFPTNGGYSLAEQGQPTPGPGAVVSKPAVLQYSCDPGHTLSFELSVCQGDNVWTPIPTCTKACKLFASYTVDYTCYSPESLSTPCQPAMPHNSYVLFECKTGHSLSRTQMLDEMRCRDGSWSVPLPECDTDCGLEIADGATFIVNAPVAKKDTLPWHVAVYRSQAQGFTFICGGTILSTRLVVSAAHCFYDPYHKQKMSAEQFHVAGNKHFQEWDHPDEAHAPKSQILEIRLPEWYKGDLHHQQNDLALLLLKTPFLFSETVGAICYDFVNTRFDKYQLSSVNKGKFAGWGVTEKQRTAQELRVLSVPFIDQRTCIDEYEKYHSERYITADKICAGYTNGSTGCNGDSGAGLVFPYPQGGELRWWLRGVLSVGPRDGFSCRSNTYTAFTRVFSLRDWIKPQINEILSQREIYKVPEGIRRVRQDKIPGCPLPEFPAHGKYSVSGCHQKDLAPGVSVEPFTYLKYACDVDYTTPDVLSECQEDGSWSPSSVCEEVIEEEGREEPGQFIPDDGCILPEFPEGGQFTISNYGEPIVPGDLVPQYTYLQYSCQDDYNSSVLFSYCDKDNKWSDNPICLKKCKMLTSYSVDFQCLNAKFTVIPCTDKLPHGTIIRPKCKQGHNTTSLLAVLKCKGGSWDSPTPSCRPDCGIMRSPSSSSLFLSKKDTKVSSPWHVGIYQQEGEAVRQACAGSLLYSNIVISAAHCFWDPIRKQPSPAIHYKVAVPKSYRDWNHEDEMDVMTSEVTQILLHELYRGDENNQQNDVALLQLTTPFALSDALHPVCYILNNDHLNAKQTRDGVRAKVFSWGREETGEPSQKLQDMTFPIIPRSSCQTEFSKYNFTRFLTEEKMCAGHTDGSSGLCRGDAGAGLVVRLESRWYLRGVVSDGPLGGTGDTTAPCWDTYTAFTQLHRLRVWLLQQLRHLT